MINKNIFREYDIRGIANEDLKDSEINFIGKAYGTYMINKGKKNLIIGRDARLSSDRIFNALVDGILATGCNIIDIGVVATPIFYFSIIHYKKDGGIMITASHNPANYNGFKVCNGINVVYGKELKKIYDIALSKSFKSGSGKIEKLNVIDDYIKRITEDMFIDRNLKVVIDCGNGTAGIIAKKLFSSLGLNPTILYENPDGAFPNHEADPTVLKNLKDLIYETKKQKADIGIAFDGDVDRIGVVDELGNVVYGDKLLAIYSNSVISKNPGAEIIFEVKSSQSLIDYLKKIGAKPLMWKVGHSLIKAKMREDNALLAGEMSGHMFFKDRYYGFDDAFYAALRILEILSHSNKTLSQLVNELPKYYSTPEIRIDCPDDKKFIIIESLKEKLSQKHNINDIDGIRINFDDGWALVRASNTQPVLVLRFEAKNKENLKRYIKIIEENLSRDLQIQLRERVKNLNIFV